jgi:Carboxypeptidase regulatory-like domain
MGKGPEVQNHITMEETTMNFTLRRLFLAAALLLTGTGSLDGQTSVAGSLTGYVSDASGAAVIDANVQATNNGTGVISQATTNNSGIYRFTGLLPGMYSVAIVKQSFATFTRLDVKIDAGTGVRVDGVLAIGTATSGVTVTGDRPLLQTESGSVSQTIDEKQISALPTFGRNITRLSLLAPGASMQQSQLDNHPENAGQDYDVDVNGANPYNNSKILDGVDNNEAVQGKSLLVTSQDSVQEIKFTTNSYDAE